MGALCHSDVFGLNFGVLKCFWCGLPASICRMVAARGKTFSEYGEKVRKRTRFLCANFPRAQSLAKLCRCKSKGATHVTLSGWGRGEKRSTKTAAAYPPPFCEQLAKALSRQLQNSSKTVTESGPGKWQESKRLGLSRSQFIGMLGIAAALLAAWVVAALQKKTTNKVQQLRIFVSM
eukprot:1024964-Amphidinium_carterae.1